MKQRTRIGTSCHDFDLASWSRTAVNRVVPRQANWPAVSLNECCPWHPRGPHVLRAAPPLDRHAASPPDTGTRAPSAARPLVTAQRDAARARQRYQRWTKGLLIERRLAVERAYAAQEERWLRVNDELLACQLRAASAPPQRATVRADPTDIGGPHHG